MGKNDVESGLYGRGIYTVGDAARLTRIPQGSIRRWLWTSPLWSPQSPVSADFTSLGFSDLMEIRFVHAFRQQGVSLQHIRQALQKAQELFDLDYPLSTLRFKTDGSKIFADILPDGTKERWLIEMPTGQHAFDFILKGLYEGLEWSASGRVLVWRPRNNNVVIDPKRSFGEPIVETEGVPTDVIYRSYLAEQSVSIVAKSYDINPDSVKEAVEFETSLAA